MRLFCIGAFVFASTLFSASAWSYIPEYSMITARAADQHGRGAYEIEQDVIIRKEAEAFVVREKWLVTGENTMRLTIEGRGPLKGLVSGTILFDGHSRLFYDGSSVRSQKLGDEWLEPFFHFRTSRYFRSRLVHLKVAPADSLKDRAPLSSEAEAKDLKYEAPPFVRLSRVGGTVAWAIGAPPTQGDAPTLWLEQDQFVVRKYKSQNQVILSADDYNKYEDTFFYPRSRTYQFSGFTVNVQTVKVHSAGRPSNRDKRFLSSTLAAEKDTVKLPDVDGLRDFYLRFR